MPDLGQILTEPGSVCLSSRTVDWGGYLQRKDLGPSDRTPWGQFFHSFVARLPDQYAYFGFAVANDFRYS